MQALSFKSLDNFMNISNVSSESFLISEIFAAEMATEFDAFVNLEVMVVPRGIAIKPHIAFSTREIFLSQVLC